jgi:hypothetical protein
MVQQAGGQLLIDPNVEPTRRVRRENHAVLVVAAAGFVGLCLLVSAIGWPEHKGLLSVADAIAESGNGADAVEFDTEGFLAIGAVLVAPVILGVCHFIDTDFSKRIAYTPVAALLVILTVLVSGTFAETLAPAYLRANGYLRCADRYTGEGRNITAFATFVRSPAACPKGVYPRTGRAR